VHCTCPLVTQSGHCLSALFGPRDGNHHLQRTWPQRSRQQLRPPQPGPAPQAPQPGPHPGPPHPGPPPPRQRTRPHRSRQQRRPHCTSVKLSTPAVAAAGSGRIGAAWVVREPPAKTRPATPTANIMRNIVVTRFSMVDPLVVEVPRMTKRLINSRTAPPFHEWSFRE
jgi:hypothetical protein